jgi:succinate-semialdehyde dehydrogenase/glutarate-semialdehyde dehydrogenase
MTGGSPIDALNTTGGTFYHPTVVTEVTTDMLPYHEETFGPAAFLFRFETEDEVIKLANDTK